jgi:hypothetical protein
MSTATGFNFFLILILFCWFNPCFSIPLFITDLLFFPPMNVIKTLLNKPSTPVRTLAELNARAVHNTKTRTLTHSQGRVVVLGSGWAGRYTWKLYFLDVRRNLLTRFTNCCWLYSGFKFMKDLSRKDYEVTVVSPRNYFVFTPLLARYVSRNFPDMWFE